MSVLARPTIVIKPNEGQQTKFLSTKADVCFFGGGAGGGKSRGILMDAVRYFNVPGYSAVIFRKSYGEIKNAGGLWDDSYEIYPLLGGEPRESCLDWNWPEARSNIAFSHFQHEKNKKTWQGSQIAFIGWDEVTHFDSSIFWYMFSRNRSKCGVKPCIRATCNPEPGSWVADLLDWWIGEDGFPIPERDGVLRWFVRDGDSIMWKDDPSEFGERSGDAKSLTFIKSVLKDNPVLVEKDPSYRASLLALPLYERMLLLDGNWKVSRGGGMRFKKHWFEIVDTAPECDRIVRYWDRAGTELGDQNKNPDYTAGVSLGRTSRGGLYVLDSTRFRATPGKVLAGIRNTAIQDSCPDVCELWLEEDPASAGKAERHYLSQELAEFGPRWNAPNSSKWVRSGPVSAACENGLIKIVRGPWNKAFLDELDKFLDEKTMDPPPGYHDDQVDAFSGAFNVLTRSGLGPRLHALG